VEPARDLAGDEPLDEVLDSGGLGPARTLCGRGVVTATMLSGAKTGSVAWTDEPYLAIDDQ
jgi:hypothetical protein